MQLTLKIDGRNFYFDWIKKGKENILRYENFIAKGPDPTKCLRFVKGYIRLHNEFIKPNGMTELKKTLDKIVEGVIAGMFGDARKYITHNKNLY